MSATAQLLYIAIVATGLSTAATIQALPFMPRPGVDDYFTVASVTAERAGDTAVLHVDRSIKSHLLMSYAVRVFAVSDNGARMTCEARGGPFNYRPDATLPDTITLDWWTAGQCQTIPRGRVEIETTWDPVVPDFPPISVTTEVEG